MPKAGDVQVTKQGGKLVVSVEVSPEQIQTGVDDQGAPVMKDEVLTDDVCASCEAALMAIRQCVRDDRAAARADAEIAEATAAKNKGRLAVKP